MFVRLTYLNFFPEKIADVKKIYNEEVAVSIRSQEGNVDAMLLEPVNGADDHISCTMWKNKEAADMYQASENYHKDFIKIKEMTTSQPQVKFYEVERD